MDGFSIAIEEECPIDQRATLPQGRKELAIGDHSVAQSGILRCSDAIVTGEPPGSRIMGVVSVTDGRT